MENSDADQTDRSAALNNNSAVEFQDSCCFCSLYCMYKYCTWLDEDTGIKIQVAYIEECGTEFSASDEDVISEPSVEFYIVIWKSPYTSAPPTFFLLRSNIVISGSSLKIIHVTILSPTLTGLPAVSTLTFLPIFTISPVPSCPSATGIRLNGSLLNS